MLAARVGAARQLCAESDKACYQPNRRARVTAKAVKCMELTTVLARSANIYGRETTGKHLAGGVMQRLRLNLLENWRG